MKSSQVLPRHNPVINLRGENEVANSVKSNFQGRNIDKLCHQRIPLAGKIAILAVMVIGLIALGWFYSIILAAGLADGIATGSLTTWLMFRKMERAKNPTFPTPITVVKPGHVLPSTNIVPAPILTSKELNAAKLPNAPAAVTTEPKPAPTTAPKPASLVFSESPVPPLASQPLPSATPVPVPLSGTLPAPAAPDPTPVPATTLATLPTPTVSDPTPAPASTPDPKLSALPAPTVPDPTPVPAPTPATLPAPTGSDPKPVPAPTPATLPTPTVPDPTLAGQHLPSATPLPASSVPVTPSPQPVQQPIISPKTAKDPNVGSIDPNKPLLPVTLALTSTTPNAPPPVLSGTLLLPQEATEPMSPVSSASPAKKSDPTPASPLPPVALPSSPVAVPQLTADQAFALLKEALGGVGTYDSIPRFTHVKIPKSLHEQRNIPSSTWGLVNTPSNIKWGKGDTNPWRKGVVTGVDRTREVIVLKVKIIQSGLQHYLVYHQAFEPIKVVGKTYPEQRWIDGNSNPTKPRDQTSFPPLTRENIEELKLVMAGTHPKYVLVKE